MKKNFVMMALASLALAFTGCLPEPIMVSSITLSPSTLTLEVGATKQLTVTISPINADDPTVTSKSSDTSVATISPAGVVTAVAPGIAIITVSANDGSGKSDTCNVTVNAPVVEPTVDITSSLSLTAVNELKYSAITAEDATPATITVAAGEKIKTLTLALATDNVVLNAILDSMDLTEPFELSALTPAQKTGLDLVGIPSGDDIVGQNSVTLPLDGLFGVIATQIPGGIEKFDITVDATDGDGREAETATLQLKFTDDHVYVSIAGDGFDIAEEQTLLASEAETAALKLNVTAEEGIANLMIGITSDNEAFMGALALMGLDAEFDLANPGALAAVLSSPVVGLPNGDDVLGKDALAFDLSAFVPMLFGFEGDFSVEFELSVTDASDLARTEVKTLTLNLVDDIPAEDPEESEEEEPETPEEGEEEGGEETPETEE
ncbi:MAG: Ig-like domain-containing protein [Alistipes sp.]|nr:Ig-like domain-containing protein [Alistipes sp.]